MAQVAAAEQLRFQISVALPRQPEKWHRLRRGTPWPDGGECPAPRQPEKWHRLRRTGIHRDASAGGSPRQPAKWHRLRRVRVEMPRARAASRGNLKKGKGCGGRGGAIAPIDHRPTATCKMAQVALGRGPTMLPGMAL